MKIYLVSMMNAFVLMIFGLWSFIGSETPSLTALIPIMTVAFLLSLIHGLRYGSKPAANISMVLTSLILIAMMVPFIGALGHNAVSYTHLRAHETKANLVCRLLLEK